MGLTTSGIFSGINTDDVVGKLMQVERQPLLKLQKKEADYQAKISGLGNLLSSLNGFKTAAAALKATNLLSMKANSGDSNIFTATAATGASPANHTIKISNLAAAQSIYSATFASTTDAVADLSSVATQKMQIQVGAGAAFTITVDATNNTLSGIKDAINKAKTDVTASIMNDGTGNRLVLSSTKTGTASKIVIKVDENNDGVFEEAPDDTDVAGLSKLAFNATYDVDGNVTGGIASMTQSQVAKNASLIVDGLTVTKSSNTITDVIEGVTLTLKKDSAGATVNLDVTKDIDGLKAKINLFVTTYNTAMSQVKSLQGTSASRGVLMGDSTISSLKSTLTGTIVTGYSNTSLARMGITHDTKAVLSFNTTTFDTEFAANEANVLSALNAMATALETKLDTYIKSAIPDKQKSYESSSKLLAKRQEEMLRRLDKVELELKKKFNSLDQRVQQLQGQGTYLAQNFAALNNSQK